MFAIFVLHLLIPLACMQAKYVVDYKRHYCWNSCEPQHVQVAHMNMCTQDSVHTHFNDFAVILPGDPLSLSQQMKQSRNY